MTSIRILVASASALALASCSWFNKGGDSNYDTTGGSNGYDTSNPYGVPGAASEPAPQQQQQGNPTYSQAAYEDTTTAAAPNTYPSIPEAPRNVAPPAPTPSPVRQAPVTGGSGTVHVVTKGDTLWGIGKKYSVSVDAIKKANGMTKDTVVLGAKLQIPAH